MAVVIIKTDERLSIEIQEATFYYRRIPGHVRSDIVEKYTNNRTGKVDWGKASIAMLQYSILGWKNIIEPNGNEIVFDSEMIKFLPDEVTGELVEAMGANVSIAALDVEVKNSLDTPSSSSLTKDLPVRDAENDTD